MAEARGMADSSEDRLKDSALTSWKEIAQYLARGIRTVQRWEAELGLPVRRPGGKKRGGVMALPSEIDEWLKACPVSALEQMGDSFEQVPDAEADEVSEIEASQLIMESRLLRQNLERTRKDLTETVSRFTESCRKLEPGTMVSGEMKLWPTVRNDSGASPTVLVVDDNEIQGYTMRKTLSLAGFSVIYADSGQQGLAMSKQARPDAIVLDVNMPDLSGFDVCSRIKKDPETCDIPTIFYTSAGPAGKDYAESLGAAAFLTYPIDPAHLTLVLQVSLAKSGHWHP